MPTPQLSVFTGASQGLWRVEEQHTLTGDPLPEAAFVTRHEGEPAVESAWRLRGVVSSLRYTTAGERAALVAAQAPLGRPKAVCAALIPIRKSEAWWALAQDERRAIFEERGRHTTIGLEYLPAIARQLHHGRDLGEPFDFLTWFEWAPEHTSAFDEMLRRLRGSPEWGYVEREVEIRLRREAAPE